MSKRLRAQRNEFLLFLAAMFIALMAALPIVAAQTPKKEPPAAPAGAGASAPAQPASEIPRFSEADRNQDGVLDKSEAGRIPGLSANFERADRNRDGKLDEEEFARGLEILQVRR